MPKPDSISPSAIVQVFEPLGSTGTHLLKKIARHHRQQNIRPIRDVLWDAVKMKRDIRERSMSLRQAKLEAAYRWFQTRCEKMLLGDITDYSGFDVQVSGTDLAMKFGVSLILFSEYFASKNPHTNFNDQITFIKVKGEDGQKTQEKGFLVTVRKSDYPEFFVED